MKEVEQIQVRVEFEIERDRTEVGVVWFVLIGIRFPQWIMTLYL
jgi:hypothetical protein